MSYAGYYINLDRSTGRRAQIEEQIARLGLSETYRRFAAASGNALNFPNTRKSKIARWDVSSRIIWCSRKIWNSQKPLHVMEDDVLLAGCMEQTVRWIVGNNGFGEFDIIYTDTSIPPANTYYKSYKTLFDKVVTFNDEGRHYTGSVSIDRYAGPAIWHDQFVSD